MYAMDMFCHICRTPGSQHLHHNSIPYMPNSKQQSPGLYGTNVQNHLRNVSTITSPAQLATQSSQPHGQQEMSVSPLTSDIMASITQRANQLHQQNLYKTTPMQPLHHQPQVQHYHNIIIHVLSDGPIHIINV